MIEFKHIVNGVVEFSGSGQNLDAVVAEAMRYFGQYKDDLAEKDTFEFVISGEVCE